MVPWSVPNLLPHGGEMILIDSVIDAGDDWAKTSVQIAEDCMFFRPGLGVPAWVGSEYMAQTISLCAGLEAKKLGEDIRIGLFLGTRRYSASVEYFRLGMNLTVFVNEVWRDKEMAVFECEIECGETLASARLNVFQPRDPAAFLAGQSA